MVNGNFKPDGDQEKAIEAVYEVIVSVGVGAGREAERMVPLGRDLAANLKHVQDGYAHAMEVFGEVCNSTYKEGDQFGHQVRRRRGSWFHPLAQGLQYC